MGSLEIKLHKKGWASIMDSSKDVLTLADGKWTKLFDFCNNAFETAYFIGYRTQYMDEGFKKTIESVSENTFFIEKSYLRIMLKVKPAFLQLNRSLFNKLWNYYEFPSLVYLADAGDEDQLVNAYRIGTFHEDIVKQFKDILIFNRLTEENVVWIRAGFEISGLLALVQDE